MVKYIAGGLLFSVGVEAARWELPSTFRPMFFYRSSSDHCCNKIQLENAKNSELNGVYDFHSNAANGRSVYKQTNDDGEDNWLTGENVGLWLFQTQTQRDTGANVGSAGYFTNNQCVINQMVSTDDWKEQDADGQNQDADYLRVTCLTNVDECRTNICPSGECEDVEGGYNCNGATDDWDQCADNGGAVCTDNSVCVEQNPGYSCDCVSGFAFNNVTNTCDDVDECDDNPCGENNGTKCTNIDGSYTCSCADGYENFSDGSCDDIDECAAEEDPCDGADNASCKNIDGDFECACASGFAHDGDSKSSCSDIDECAGNPCGGSPNLCANNDGGYECICSPMFAHQKGNSCVDIDECKETNVQCDIGEICVNNDFAQPSCECPEGFDGLECANNINDCTADGGYQNNCTWPQLCVDGVNSWSCGCDDGFEQDDNGDCVDIDSCADENFCKDHHDCTNGRGSDFCTCKSGFNKVSWGDNGEVCEDVNECDDADLNKCPANSKCENTYGGFSCNCNGGYETNPDDASECIDVDECKTGELVCTGAGEECDNSEGSASCLCSAEGYTGLRDADRNCVSVDDCVGVSCGDNKHCVDGHMTYSCACDDGYEENDQDVCIDIDDCADDPCAADPFAICVDLVNDYRCECADKTFFKMQNDTCVDINECEEGTHSCSGTHQTCDNGLNGFTCGCEPGWKMINSTCANVNECANGDVCTGPYEYCDDTQGGNLCLCLDGFYRANLTHPGDCENKNECNNALDFTCQANSECRDTHGSYACDCNDGFVAGFDIAGNAVCNDVDECKGEVSCPENSSCRNNFGSWGCACDIGYENDPDSEECVSTTDCGSSIDTCNGDFEECKELDGADLFECVCEQGYEYDADGKCIDADDCKNGNVKCDTKNSHCETNVAGWASCVCDNGFLEETLTAADNSTYNVCNDIDECKDELDNCHDNAKCTNTPGSYECECEGEYSGDGETCIICPSLECWTFDAGTNTCTPRDECSTLECGAEGLKIGFVNGLFGIDNNGANFLGDQPTLVNETSGEWELTSAFGTNGMTFELDNSTNTVTFYLVVSLAGDDRARSDFEQTNSLINLGDRSIMTTPFGVGMLFSCQYSTVIELSSVSYTVEDVSISDSQSGRGDWSSTFSLAINGGSDSDLILGQMLPVAVSWSASGLDGQLDFYIRTAVVTHGSTMVAIAKESCLSDAAGAVAISDSGLTKSFEYKLFKGVNEDTTEQTIDVSVVICKAGECAKASSSADCPQDGENQFYNYQPFMVTP